MDINRENYELGLPVIEKAGVAHKIDFREGPALPVLDLMVEDVNFSNPLASFFHFFLVLDWDKFEIIRFDWKKKLNLLKLNIENKIIFKYIHSTTILLMKKMLKIKVGGSVNSAQICHSRKNSQNL